MSSKPSFIAAEQRQLDLLMAKKAQAVEASKALAGQASWMTDAAKRRCTTDEESLQSWDEGEFISEQLTLEALKASEEAAESPGNIPTSVQEPKHLDLSEINMKSAADMECRRYCSWLIKTYATTEAMTTTMNSDGCLAFAKQPVTQAVDLALYLSAACFQSEVCGKTEGYLREFK
eukprot:s2949_g12.t1